MTPKRRRDSHFGGLDKNGNGPLDEVTGQHQALPVALTITRVEQIDWDEAYTNVDAYLGMVRVEAEASVAVAKQERVEKKRMVEQERGVEQERVVEQDTVVEQERVASPSVDDPFPVAHSAWHAEFIAEFQNAKHAWGATSPSTTTPTAPLTATTASEWRKCLFTDPPEMAAVMQMDHLTALRLIVYISKWLNRSTNAPLCRWSLALLLRIPETLEAGDISSLRQLGVKAVKLRGKETSIEARLAHACIISVVGEVFRQRDLLEGI